ncbi:MAG: hypothetical protein GY811_18225 [Myxococcales bacterium]|nr:hypothetical protein [Myxococcales bacterium]
MMSDIRSYNEGLRWDKLPQSAIHIPPAERDAFLDEREQLQDELRIDDFDITRLKTEGETQGRANVQIRWIWHMDRVGIVKKTTSEQRWKRQGKRWLMIEEVFVRGDEMPGLAEAKDEVETGTGKSGIDPDGLQGEDDARPEASAREAAHQDVVMALRRAAKPHRIAE